MADSPEGMIDRNLSSMAICEPELAAWAAVLVRHLRSPDDYTCVGSIARDEQARITGEFKREFKIGPVEEKPQRYFDALVQETEVVYA